MHPHSIGILSEKPVGSVSRYLHHMILEKLATCYEKVGTCSMIRMSWFMSMRLAICSSSIGLGLGEFG